MGYMAARSQFGASLGARQWPRSHQPRGRRDEPEKPASDQWLRPRSRLLPIHRRRGQASVSARVELRAFVRPDDVRLQRLHGVGIGIDLHSLVWLLDTPVDHVPERGALVHLLLELGALVGSVV